MILVNRVELADRFRVGAEFICKELSSNYFMLGWFAVAGRDGFIFTGEYKKAAQMSEEYALEMVEYLKYVHKKMWFFWIHGKRYNVLSRATCTCDIESNGLLSNIRKF